MRSGADAGGGKSKIKLQTSELDLKMQNVRPEAREMHGGLVCLAVVQLGMYPVLRISQDDRGYC